MQRNETRSVGRAARAKWDPSGSRAGQVGSCAAKETSLGRVGRLLGARELVVLGILVLEERDGRHRRVRAVDGMVGAANDLPAGRVCHKRTTSSDAAIELRQQPKGDKNHEVLRLASNPDIILDSDRNDHRKRGGSEQAQPKSERPLIIALQAVGGVPPIAGDELV